MDEEALKLLREIRDIALRNEAVVRKDLALRKRVFIVVFVGLAIALGALWHLLRVLDVTVEESKPAAAVRQ